jgi:hypothetical protein
MIKKLFIFPFFAFLLGLFPIIALWNGNKSQVYPKDVWLSVGITAAFVLVIWFLCLLIFRSPDRASLVSSALFLIVFSYGHVYNLIKGMTLFGSRIGFVKLLIAYAIFLVILLILAILSKKISPDVKLVLNSVFTLLILFNVFQIVSYEIKTKRAEAIAENSAASTATTITTAETSILPDIYYIILDSYSRQDVLKDMLGYDNSTFIDGLRERGFYVADCSNSNYSGTVSSLTSTLNYEFLNATAEEAAEDEGTAILSMKDSRIRADLAAFGYQFVTTKGFSSEDDVNNSDIYLNYLTDTGQQDTIARSEFTRMYFETTVLRVLFEYYHMDQVKYEYLLPQWLFQSYSGDDKVLGYASFWYNQTKYVFDSMEKLPEQDGNYFVYAHVNVPHQPFVFDANGNFKYTYNPAVEEMAQPYLDQISYANKRVLQLVDVLISKSTPPPIIIIQGDHGAHVLTTGLEKHKILNVYYVPEKMYNDLYETITPVNTFRLVLRDVFNQNIDLLPDTMFVKITNNLEPLPSTCPVP